MTQEQIILKVLTDEWTPSYDLIKRSTDYGWLGTSADRIARKMAENGEIDRERRGKYSYYRLKEKEKLVFGDRKTLHDIKWGKYKKR